jgi:hypothetical protein
MDADASHLNRLEPRDHEQFLKLRARFGNNTDV